MQLSCLETSKLLLKTNPPLQFTLRPDSAQTFLSQLGLLEQTARSRWLKPQTSISPCFPVWKGQTQGAAGSAPCGALFLACRWLSCVSSHGREQASPRVSFSSYRNTLMGPHPHALIEPNSLPEASPPDTRLGLQHRDLGGHTYPVHTDCSCQALCPLPTSLVPMISKPRGRGGKFPEWDTSLFSLLHFCSICTFLLSTPSL